MGRFNNDRRGGGFQKRSFGGGERKEMHDAVCDNCGRNCQVPFQPTSGKPVYCSDCFEKMGGNDRRDDRGGRDRDRGSRNSFGGRDDRPRQMYDAVCDNCGRDCQVPFMPSTDKPIYCSNCFEEKGGGDRRDDRGGRDRGPRNAGGGKMNDEILFQIADLNSKFERILEILDGGVIKIEKPAMLTVKKDGSKKLVSPEPESKPTAEVKKTVKKKAAAKKVTKKKAAKE